VQEQFVKEKFDAKFVRNAKKYLESKDKVAQPFSNIFKNLNKKTQNYVSRMGSEQFG